MANLTAREEATMFFRRRLDQITERYRKELLRVADEFLVATGSRDTRVHFEIEVTPHFLPPEDEYA